MRRMITNKQIEGLEKVIKNDEKNRLIIEKYNESHNAFGRINLYLYINNGDESYVKIPLEHYIGEYYQEDENLVQPASLMGGSYIRLTSVQIETINDIFSGLTEGGSIDEAGAYIGTDMSNGEFYTLSEAALENTYSTLRIGSNVFDINQDGVILRSD